MRYHSKELKCSTVAVRMQSSSAILASSGIIN
jgi:hypothetical protein